MHIWDTSSPAVGYGVIFRVDIAIPSGGQHGMPVETRSMETSAYSVTMQPKPLYVKAR